MGKLNIKGVNGNYINIEPGDGTPKSLTNADFKYIRNTVAEIPTVGNPGDGDVLLVKGYHENSDGGHGTFIWDPNADKSEHNGGTVIDPLKAFPSDWDNEDLKADWFNGNNSGTGCWRRLYDGAVNVKWFGAKGDGVADDTQSIQKAVYTDNVVFNNSEEYCVSSNLSIINSLNGNNTTIKFINDAYLGVTTSNIHIKELNINQNIYTGQLYIYTNDSDVENIIVENCNLFHDEKTTTKSHNMTIKTSNDYNISNVKINNCNFYYAYGDGYSTADNLYIASYSADGTGVVRDVEITNCTFNKCARNNISIAGSNDDGKPSNINISNCKCYNSALAGIDLEDGGEVTITNINFKNNGQFESGDWSSDHILEDSANSGTQMRSGVSLHHTNNSVVSNSTFVNCYYAFAGYAELFISNCIIENSLITNASSASGTNLNISNSKIITNSIDNAVVVYEGKNNFINCAFIGIDDNSKCFIFIKNSDSTSITQNIFKSCKFTGNQEVATLQYGYVEFDKCEFNGSYIIIKNDNSTRYNTCIIRNSTLLNTTYGVLNGYKWRDNLIFNNNYCYGCKSYVVSTNQEKSVSINNNIIYCNFTDGDGLSHNAIDCSNGIGSGCIKGNIIDNSGTATDSIGIYYVTKNTERENSGINISDNVFLSGLNQGLKVVLYNNSTLTNSACENNVTLATNGNSISAFFQDASNNSADAPSGLFSLNNLPTSDPGVAGQLWNDNGAVKVSAG